jgi:hypothetical protein
MRKLLLASVAGVAVVAGAPANAADLAARPTYKAPPVVAPVPMFISRLGSRICDLKAAGD